MSNQENSEILQSFADNHRPVLVAVDFSEDSRAAIVWAAAFTARAGGRLILLHIVHDPADQPGYYRSEHTSPLQTMEQSARGMLEKFVSRLQADYPDLTTLQTAESKLLSGLPPGRIIEAAELLQAKLIVIGSRGMTGLPHLMQGSVSERVVELAAGPVVVVKAAGQQRKTSKDLKRDQKQKKKQEKRLKKLEKEARKTAKANDRRRDPEETVRHDE
jgi:nucleotide-binding universal stress UspA family protein